MTIDHASVRLLRDDDLEALLGLYAHLHVAESPHPTTAARQTWERIRRHPGIFHFGAEVDGRVVSTCTIAIIPNLTRDARPYGVIENVVTHPDHRCRGLGTAVLHAANRLAWDQGCYKVMLMTERTEPSTLRFYVSAGFLGGVKTAFVSRRPPDV